MAKITIVLKPKDLREILIDYFNLSASDIIKVELFGGEMIITANKELIID